jgi:transcriptional regulator with XRE-family HTH domain
VDSRVRDQIRGLIAEGKSSDEIASQLGISKQRVAAVKAHTTMGHYTSVLIAELAPSARKGDPSAREALNAEAVRVIRRAASGVDRLMPEIRAMGAAHPDLVEGEPLGLLKPGVLGRSVHMRRVEIGLKRKELADRAQLSYQYLSAIENGAKDPSIVAVVRLADALGMTLFELMSPPRVPSTAPPAPDIAPPREVTSGLGDEAVVIPAAAPVEDSSASMPYTKDLQTLVTESVRTALDVWARIELPQLVAAALARTP